MLTCLTVYLHLTWRGHFSVAILFGKTQLGIPVNPAAFQYKCSDFVSAANRVNVTKKPVNVNVTLAADFDAMKKKTHVKWSYESYSGEGPTENSKQRLLWETN